ncbi:MAG: GGDEF domain-containing protein [Myxococcota bacterium]|nr:GGDEF domain-containing protein [Myxococcota bacterium]
MRHESLEAISLPGIARAFLWVFLSLFGLLLLLEYATATPTSPQAALLQAAIESTLVTALFAILGAALIGQPLREWIEREQLRVATREEALHRAVARQQFSARLAQALSHAADESEARWVLHRAVGQVSADAPVELLLKDSAGKLGRVLLGGAAHEEFGCPVVRGGICPAIRSGQPREASSDDLGACRMLVDRGEGCHGLCMPVTINGTALGVLHTTRNVPADDELRSRLQTIAEQAGIRLGLLSMMAASEQAASTDELTGLLNRRALNEKVSALLDSGRQLSVVLADIDHFKKLNDTYGHQVGDRALQAFSYALSSYARPSDIVARLGGEEFVLVLPDASAEGAQRVVERIQAGLTGVLTSSGVPRFTSSFGISDLRHGNTLTAMLKAADTALYAAKHAGRDQALMAS